MTAYATVKSEFPWQNSGNSAQVDTRVASGDDGAGQGVGTPAATPSAAESWSHLVDETMDGKGGIDMDSWPGFAGSSQDVDVAPYTPSGNSMITDFQAANGAGIVDFGAIQPTPAQCRSSLASSANKMASIVVGDYYCVTTSAGKRILFQAVSPDEGNITLRGFAVRDS